MPSSSTKRTVDRAFLLDFASEYGCLAHMMRLLRKNGKVVLLLDIDEAAILGADTNDIGRLILTMFKAELDNRSKEAALMQVARALVNPRLVEAFKFITSRVDDVHVIFYTQKSNILTVLRTLGVPMPYISGDTIIFKEEPLVKGYRYIREQCDTTNDRVRLELDRLGLVTCAVAETLGLDYLPSVLVTEWNKDVHKMARLLGLDADNCFLYDDKATTHVDRLPHDRVYATKHMIPVQPYTFKSMGAEQAETLQALLEEHFPVTGIKESHPDLFKEIVCDPRWPRDKQCITADER